MKVSVMTLQNVRNYGSVLQAEATRKILSRFFDEVEFVDYYREDIYGLNLIDTIAGKNTFGLKKIIFKVALVPTYLRWKSLFGSYISSHLKVTDKIYFNSKSFIENPIESDAYCVGSDQVWNSGWNKGILSEFFWANNDGFKFSLSSSFGKTELEANEKKVIHDYLKSFNAISVREISGKEIINDLGLESEVLLDPTLQVDKEYWLSQACSKINKKKYALVYQLNKSKKFEEYVSNFSKVNNIPLIRICIRYDQINRKGKKVFLPSVEKFLALFRDAEYVLTDSFHGTSFAINFNKNFSILLPNDYSSRLTSVTRLFGLESRIVKDFDSFDLFHKKIDFEKINLILTKERNKALSFLTRVIGDLKNDDFSCGCNI